jgi:cyclic pyranopterin phosphate synthase
MVDVGSKPETARRARAESFVALSAAARRRVRENTVEKGDVLATARLAGISAAKRTSELIPLCHPLRLVTVRVEPRLTARGVRIETEVTAVDRTGVEMEALTAASVAALVVYDMTKAIDKGAVIGPVRLLEKEGGASGRWVRRRG